MTWLRGEDGITSDPSAGDLLFLFSSRLSFLPASSSSSSCLFSSSLSSLRLPSLTLLVSGDETVWLREQEEIPSSFSDLPSWELRLLSFFIFFPKSVSGVSGDTALLLSCLSFLSWDGLSNLSRDDEVGRFSDVWFLVFSLTLATVVSSAWVGNCLWSHDEDDSVPTSDNKKERGTRTRSDVLFVSSQLRSRKIDTERPVIESQYDACSLSNARQKGMISITVLFHVVKKREEQKNIWHFRRERKWKWSRMVMDIKRWSNKRSTECATLRVNV